MQSKFASNSTKRLSGHWGTKPRKIREVVNFILTWPPCQIWNLFSWFGQNRFRKSSVLQDVDLSWCSKTQIGHVMWGGEVWNRMCSTYAKKKWNSLVKMSCLSLTQFLRYLWRNLFSQSSSKDFAQFSVFRFSAPKWKKVAANQSYVFLQESFHKKSSSFSGHVFHFGSEKGEEQLKKTTL